MSSGEKGKIFKYTHKGLPFSKGKFIGDDKFLAVGYDKAPFLFIKSGDKWSLDKVLDKGFDKFKDFSAKVGSKDFFALRYRILIKNLEKLSLISRLMRSLS